MSSMHRKALTLALLVGSAATVGATLAPQPAMIAPANPNVYSETQPRVQPPVPYTPAYSASPARSYAASRISSAVAQWRSLRQTDNLPFSSYASFLTNYRGWPGETSMRRTAERAIDPMTTSPSEIVSYFRVHPPLTASGHARHAFALQALGRVDEARQAARQAWFGGVMPRTDEDRLIGLFSSALTAADHDRRLEILLANGDATSAQRILYYASPARRAVYEARVALQTNSSDASGKLAMIGSAGSNDAGVIMDRAKWLRKGSQSVAARSLLAQPRQLASLPQNPEKWYETLLEFARAAANDRNWSTAYQIASQMDDALPAGADVSRESVGTRDHYTSLAWLAGTTALQKLNRPADAANMFVKYARGGRSAQVASKGYYWAGRAAQAAGQPMQASSYFTQAAAFPELFYGQLALERIGRPVPAPVAVAAVQPTEADRAAFNNNPLVEAVRHLGQMGAWEDQSLFVRALAEAKNDRERVLAAELSRQIARPDLGVWIARNARNDGTPFYVRAAYPEVQIPPAQSNLWSLSHGIIRQESSFDRAAVSHAGARGMMQLMTPTARETAGKLGTSYDFGRLTGDPTYNIMLGSAYFESLMSYWGGYAPLAVASYNAGAGNVRKWVRENGDPRLPNVDVITWIEEIPFSETRGYVQRVLENAVVYDAMNPSRARTPEQTRLSSYLGKVRQPG